MHRTRYIATGFVLSKEADDEIDLQYSNVTDKSERVVSEVAKKLELDIDEIIFCKYSKFVSSIVIVCSWLLNIIERGVNINFIDGKNKVHTCYTAIFFSIASFSDIIVINI